jgi:hypothetical protein
MDNRSGHIPKTGPPGSENIRTLTKGKVEIVLRSLDIWAVISAEDAAHLVVECIAEMLE